MKTLGYIAICLCLFVIWYCVCRIIDPTLTVTSLVDAVIKGIAGIFKPASAPPLTPQDLYLEQQVNYKNFATIVWECLNQVGARCNLVVPGYADGTYAFEVADRVKVDGGIYTFCYEAQRTAPNYDGGLKKSAVMPVTDIERIFNNNLPGHWRGGYYYNGEIHVWERENNTVLIEVHGVNRQYHLNTGGIEI